MLVLTVKTKEGDCFVFRSSDMDVLIKKGKEYPLWKLEDLDGVLLDGVWVEEVVSEYIYPRHQP